MLSLACMRSVFFDYKTIKLENFIEYFCVQSVCLLDHMVAHLKNITQKVSVSICSEIGIIVEISHVVYTGHPILYFNSDSYFKHISLFSPSPDANIPMTPRINSSCIYRLSLNASKSETWASNCKIFRLTIRFPCF
jgi:hypothetical protein